MNYQTFWRKNRFSVWAVAFAACVLGSSFGERSAHGAAPTMSPNPPAVGIPAPTIQPMRSGVWEAKRIHRNPISRFPQLIVGRFALEGGRPAAVARAALMALRQDLGVPRLGQQLVLEETLTDAIGYTHLLYRQVVGGIPVEGGELRVHVNSEGIVTSVNGYVAPGIWAPAEAQVSESAAITLAQEAIAEELNGIKAPPVPARATNLTSTETPVLRIVADRSALTGRSQRLAWKLVLGMWEALVDAHDGSLLSRTLVGDGVAVDTYTANGASTTPGTLMASNAPPYESSSIDEEEATAHGYALEYGTYLEEAFGRDSLNDAGLRLVQTIQYANDDNAYWDGYQAVFGPGWATRDIVGHEFTHGLIDYTCDLTYSAESGALNESYADILAVMIDRDDWLQGEAAEGQSVDNPVRSLSDPHKNDRFHPDQSYDSELNSGQPAHYDERVTSNDPICSSTGDSYNGCVHFNSGIQNHAIYLLAEGGQVDDILVLAIGRSQAEQVVYRTLLRLTSSDSMSAARDNAIEACAELYQAGSLVCRAVQNAYAAVGLGASSVTVWTVATDGSGDFTSIQEAMDAANSGDQIAISAGDYQESIVLSDKVVLITGEDGTTTRLVGAGLEPVVTLSGSGAAGSALQNLSIMGGGGDFGGGLRCNSSQISLSNVIVRGNHSNGEGGGIGAEGCEITLEQVLIDSNTAAGDGGGVMLYTGTLNSENLVLMDNISSDGSGGGLALWESSATLVDTTLEANTAAMHGGGLYQASGSLDATRLSASLNLADGSGGGMALAGDTTLLDAALDSNGADLGGGLAILAGGILEVTQSDLLGNTARLGGGVWLEGEARLSETLLSTNLADQDGGGLVLTGVLSMDNARFEGNAAGGAGGGVWANSSASGLITATTLVGNLAMDGGGLFLEGTQGLDARLLILSGNEAQRGGGLMTGGEATLTVLNSVFLENTGGEGSALFVSETSTLEIDSSILAYQQGGDPIALASTAVLTVRYSDVYQPDGDTWTDGEGLLNLEPAFVDFTADQNPDNDDLHLDPDSPCVDAGSPDSSRADVDGTRNDMGAFGGPNRGDWASEYSPCWAGMHAIAPGETLQSSLDTGDPQDGPRGNGFYYEDAYFYLQAGQTIDLYLGASFDTYLYLYGPDCSLVTYNDDGGDGYDSRISHTVEEPGYYTAVMTSYFAEKTGNYYLTLE